MADTITLHNPLDMHLHVRQGDMLSHVAPLTAHTFSGAVIMPNTLPPVKTLEAIQSYKQEILAACGDNFEPYMTLFMDKYDRAFLQQVQPHIIGIKLYPAGITTNSEGGVSSIDELAPTLEHMQDLGIPLLVHGESNGFVMDRETEFMSVYTWLATNFPDLNITMEHITTAAAVETLHKFNNLRATITLQHLFLILDDVAGGLLRPHLFCKPIAKRPHDLEALREVALAADPKVMFGSDSAPHPVSSKESCGCAAGCFTAPIALQVLCELFEEHSTIEHLQRFVSTTAQEQYGVVPPKKTVTLERKEFGVPDSYGSVVPYLHGETLAWSIQQVE